MSQKLDLKQILHFRKILYLIYLLPLIITLCALYLAGATVDYNLCGWWLTAGFIAMLGIDQLFGKELVYPSDDQLKLQKKSSYYSFLLFLSLPAAVVLSASGANFFASTNDLNWAGRIGWIFSLGLPISVLAVCPGHELIHRETHIERLIGGFLFPLVCNAVFKTEHIRSHHVNVATPLDNGTAAFNESFYRYIMRTIPRTFVNA